MADGTGLAAVVAVAGGRDGDGSGLSVGEGVIEGDGVQDGSGDAVLVEVISSEGIVCKSEAVQPNRTGKITTSIIKKQLFFTLQLIIY